MLAETAAAKPPAAVASPTPALSMTPTPAPPSDTPEPTQTSTPTPTPGPRAFRDDLAEDRGSWLNCEECEWKSSALFYGPFPVSGAYVQHYALCGECGWVTNYRASVDATYVDGPSERGYGLLLKLTDTYMMTLEITPWQTLDVWRQDLASGEWTWINGLYTGAVRTGRSNNHIQVDVHGTDPGRSDISITVNGKTVLVVFNQPADESPLGLTLFGHALEVRFENFEFEEYEPYGRPFQPDEPGIVTG
jgi:hypothetical protein